MQRPINRRPVIDNIDTPSYDDDSTYQIGGIHQSDVCGSGYGNYGEPFRTESSLKLSFDTSDQTWLLFVSEPTEFVCFYVLSNYEASVSGVVPPLTQQGLLLY